MLTATDVSTTCAVVIFRVKISCITSVDDFTLVIDLIGQFSDDVPGRLSVKPLLLAVKTCLNVIGMFRWINRMRGNFVINSN